MPVASITGVALPLRRLPDLLPCFVLLLCFAALVLVNFAAAEEPVVGQAAPDFQLTTVDGRNLTLADFKGQVLVLNFWATRCTQCKRELPLLDSYYRIQEKTGLRVLMVTTEGSLPLSKLKAVAATLVMPVVSRFKGDYFPAKNLPTHYVIDRAGVLRYSNAAALTLDDLNAILTPLLREPPFPGLETDEPTGPRINGS
jgi:cytochrome c biogenesis protein CcmG/thiol:disulfide interchange protein DsbE